MPMKPQNTQPTNPRRPTWETVGNIAVDSGMILVGDPCQLIQYRPFDTWSDFLVAIGISRDTIAHVASCLLAHRKGVAVPPPLTTTAPMSISEVTPLEEGIAIQTPFGDG